MDTIYSKQQFEGFTHRFIVKFKVTSVEEWRNEVDVTIYSNSGSYPQLNAFIEEKKTNKVESFTIEHRASKEQDEIATKFIDEVLNSL